MSIQNSIAAKSSLPAGPMASSPVLSSQPNHPSGTVTVIWPPKKYFVV